MVGWTPPSPQPSQKAAHPTNQEPGDLAKVTHTLGSATRPTNLSS